MASNALKKTQERMLHRTLHVPIASNTQTTQFSFIFKMRINIFIPSCQVDFLFQNKVLELEHLLEEHDDVEQALNDKVGHMKTCSRHSIIR